MHLHPFRLCFPLFLHVIFIGVTIGNCLADDLPAPLPQAVSTFHCIGIQVPAPDLLHTTCPLRYRSAGTARWRTAHPLSLIAGDRVYRGSIVNLNPDTCYEIEALPSAGSPGTITHKLTAYTRTALPVAPSGHVLHVSAQGADTGPGTAAAPLRTIQRAIALAVPGTTVIVHAGTYHEQVTMQKSGSTSNPVMLKAAPGETVVIDGEFTRDHAIDVRSASHIHVHGFTLRNTSASILRVSGAASDIAITSNTLIDPGSHYYDSAIEIGAGCSGTVIQDNTIRFANRKYSGGGMGISLRKTAGNHIISGNRIEGHGVIKDGIGGEQNFEITGGPYRDSDIYDNIISGCMDDAIESEGGGINVRIWRNTVSDSLVGIAVAPVIKGPTYVWRNTIINCGPAFKKLGEGDHLGHGPLFLYHNTAYSTSTQNGGYAGSGGKGLFQNVRARNNLISINGLLFYDRRQDMSNSYDYDLLHPGNPRRFLEWGAKGKTLTIDQARAMGFWKHAVVADPLLTAPPQDLTLQSGSPAIDAGEVIPNFNDNFSGKAPDIGAWEHSEK